MEDSKRKILVVIGKDNDSREVAALLAEAKARDIELTTVFSDDEKGYKVLSDSHEPPGPKEFPFSLTPYVESMKTLNELAYINESYLKDPHGPHPRKIYGYAAPIRTEPKYQRNEPCPCGSGKKFKRCCIKN